MLKLARGLAFFTLFSLVAAIAFAQTATNTNSTAHADKAAPATIPAGTTITMENWRQYQQFMPDGMVKFFEGTYFWKMPRDVQIEVGPTTIYPLPRNYQDATEKYSPQVKVVELPDGGLTLRNYTAGQPFPNPAGPHKGWEVLADMWYRYLPHLVVDTNGTGCTEDSYGSINCSADAIVYRQLSFNTDPGIPFTIPGAAGKFYTEWVMTVEPEQEKYNATLTISHTDLTRPESVYAFLPSLRRYQPISSAARCAQAEGMDVTSDDYRFGFDSNLTQLKVDFLGERKMLALLPRNLPTGKFPDGYDMPLGWPTPAWGKWELRDVYVISVSKVPAHAAGYCYGKRVMYIDKASGATLWEDLYDAHMQPWKYFALFLHPLNVPKVGMAVASGSEAEAFWDIQNKHATFFLDPGQGHPFYVNQQAPPQYLDLDRYTTPSGLNLIMR